MVIALMMASIVGGILTATLAGLGQQSFVVGLLSAPFGGSLLAVMVALLIAARTELRVTGTVSRRERLAPPSGVVWG